MNHPLIQTRRPLTPGDILSGWLEELEVTRAELARRSGLSFSTIEGLISGRAFMTGDRANRLGDFFGTTAQFWLNAQANVDAWDRANPS